MTRPGAIDLTRPDPIGTDLALYRTRVYRFTNDRRHYVLAENLEELHIAGKPVPAMALAFTRSSLNEIRASGRVPAFDPVIAKTMGLDIDAELSAREPYLHQNAPFVAPRSVVAIVGAPRSGTSHLYNLLAVGGTFAYFTTVSCWAWPSRNLTRPGRRSFTELGSEVFEVDNKNTRLLPGLVMPYEAEDVYARAIPTYRHIAGHHYELHDPKLGDIHVLTRSVSAHLDHFGRDTLLTKSPFNSLRIPLLEQLWGPKIHYIHIVRDRAGAGDSMRRNHFQFTHRGVDLTAEQAWELFTSTVEDDLPPDRHVIVNHNDLLQRPHNVLRALKSWLNMKSSNIHS